MFCKPDCHTHSVHSHDGHEPVAALLQAAQAAGLTHLTVTDHCECQFYHADGSREAIRALYRDVSALQGQGNVRLLCGVELGQPTQALQDAEDALAAAPWDFVIGSLHNLRDMDDFCFLDFTREDVPALLERYFDELLEVAQWGKFDTLAHLTYPLRYICGEYGIPVSVEPYREKIVCLFQTLIHSGKALEINTSGWRQKLGTSMPDAPWLSLYRELGGEMVTIGSDAHYSQHIGAHIDRGLETLRELGFPGITVFEQRRPVLYPFD